MIEISPIGNYRYGIKVTGHSEYAEHGQDIVCASVSILLHGVVITLMESYGSTLFDTLEVEDGHTHIKIRFITPETDSLFLMLKYTLNDLANNYPENIKIVGETNYVN